MIPKKQASPLTPDDFNLKLSDSGIPHVLIDDGAINSFNLNMLGKSESWLKKKLNEKKLSREEVFLMTVDDCGSIYIIKKEETPKQ